MDPVHQFVEGLADLGLGKSTVAIVVDVLLYEILRKAGDGHLFGIDGEGG